MPYMPILSTRPSEMVALSELPDASKDRLTPLILIKPWLGSGALSRAIDKVVHGYRERPWFAELDPEYIPSGGSDADSQLVELRNPGEGFAHWISFVEQYENAIPVLQLTELEPVIFNQQISRASALNRGVCLRIPRYSYFPIEGIVDEIAELDPINCTIILDYGQQDARILVNLIPAKADVQLLREKLPNVSIAISASSFPSNFTGVESQTIFERQFFSRLAEEVGGEGLVYSDRGSARAAEQGGGGIPRPRIDLPADADWHFFRSDCVREEDETPDEFRERRIEAYQEMANHAVDSPAWDQALNIWGTQLIKITQLGSPYGITSPAKATACRINVHLVKQSFFDQELSSGTLEEDWMD